MSRIADNGGSSSSRGLGHWIKDSGADAPKPPHAKAKLGRPVAKDAAKPQLPNNGFLRTQIARSRDGFDD